MVVDFASLLQALLEPLGYLLEPSRRLFWVFILSSLILASLAVSIQQHHFDAPRQLKALFNRAYWLNKSTLTDVLFLFGNSGFRFFILLPLLCSHLAGAIWWGGVLQSNFGDAPVLLENIPLIALLYTSVFFVAEDLSRFVLHVFLHKNPYLWRFHQVHHSATTLTPVTVHRVHPVEMSLYYLRGLLVFSLVSGTFIYCFGQRVSGLEILGVDCFGFLFNFVGANLRHSHISFGFGRLEQFFLSPAQHQLHHSVQAEHQGRNYGTCLAVWDRLNQSWLRSSVAQELTFGLYRSEDELKSYDNNIIDTA